MFRKPVVAAGILLLAVSTRLHALGLGDIEVRSALNEPFSAVVSLTSATDEQLETLKVSIASREAFSRVGLPRPVILSDFKFSVERSQAGKPVIIITSSDPVREPYMDFLLDATWPNGRLLKQYTILVDPPLTMPAAAPAPVAAVTPAPQPRAVATPPPAPQPQPQPVTTPVAAPTTVTTAPRPAATTYGPVKRNETLWQVASRVRPGSDISMEQMMLALQRANPGAFINNNINNLRRGAVLDVPTREEILSLNSAEALSEARRQHAEWRDRRSQPAEEPEAATSTVHASAPESVPEARLQLVAPEESVVEGAAAPGEATEAASGPETAEAIVAPTDDLRQELALANEEVEARRAESSELQSRVSELESQLADMQRLLELKDEQLASIQAGMTDTAVEETNADVAAETDEITVAEVDAAEQDTQAAGEEAAAAEEETAAAEATPVADQPLGLVDRMMNNPLLTGLGVIVAMVLGGIIWAATRQRRSGDLFSDEPTMESQLAEEQGAVTLSDKAMLTSMAAGEAEMSDTDPAKEADIFLAYGRVQQAEDVLLEALENDPTNRELKLKLIEVYHAGGNSESFNSHAQSFRNLVNEDDPQWQKIALMGSEMMPDNPLYQAGSAASASSAGVDFDMDLSGLDESRPESAGGGQSLDVDYQAGEENLAELPDSLEFKLDDLGAGEEEEDAGEGLLDSTDEVSTKLDLARAYIDMGDPDGARSILEEVLEEGDDQQKNEAEDLFAKLA
jgi:pilus assembly protein FimV